MTLFTTASADRIHISFFGMRNAGKSSLVNAITSQEVAIVSDVKGTTTDPVKKAMELLPLGPVLIIDTPGIDDDDQNLGKKRIDSANKILAKTDIAILVVDALAGISEKDNEIIELFEDRKLPYLVVFNKYDLLKKKKGICAKDDKFVPGQLKNAIYVSAKTGENIEALKNKLSTFEIKKEKVLLSDLISKGDMIVLVTPIDESAPKGRLILPQQRTIRDILDSGAVALVAQVEQLKGLLDGLPKKPKLVITDSQAFKEVDAIVPNDIMMTSFSILFARYKGELSMLLKGVDVLSNLDDGDKVLISEGCTHHRQCNDIGSVKLPKLIKSYSKKDISFEFTSGGEFPSDVKEYKCIVHCGGCMLNDKEMQYRMEIAKKANVPMTNYGMTIAKINGILDRALLPYDL